MGDNPARVADGLPPVDLAVVAAAQAEVFNSATNRNALVPAPEAALAPAAAPPFVQTGVSTPAPALGAAPASVSAASAASASGIRSLALAGGASEVEAVQHQAGAAAASVSIDGRCLGAAAAGTPAGQLVNTSGAIDRVAMV